MKDVSEPTEISQQIDNSIIQRMLNKKCFSHPDLPVKYLNFDRNSDHRLICEECKKEKGFDVSNLQSLEILFYSDYSTILQQYPPLIPKENNLRFELAMFDPIQGCNTIDRLVNGFRSELEIALEETKQRVKGQLMKFTSQHQEVVQQCQKIVDIKQLQRLVITHTEGADIKQLNDFIEDKWSQAEDTTHLLRNLINQLPSEIRQVSFKELDLQLRGLISACQKINFIDESPHFLSQYDLIKSTYEQSQELQVKRDNINKMIEVTQTSPPYDWNQIFLDPILDPSKKYTIHIELESKNDSYFNEFLFGIVLDQSKDNQVATSTNMSYYDQESSCGITKQVKGSMWSGNRKGKRRFEMKIHLNNHHLSVASLPDYSSIVELDKSEKIFPQKAYRVFLAILYPQDTIRITKIETE